ncbi:VOC family protein [Phyllobacterium pellucidum]|uniref:VOC family protein n=1 Tax=Phyllobacterium pellucidum TaxID=2740464 RepID=UPI001D15563B|nr:VOC family protein [Phyllobacterium sp. T1018]UGY11109.1 VOC family protein [Phyllobacterium sp. T1018]
MTTPGNFIWYELMTTDAEAAEAFYGDVVGWDPKDSGHPDMRYTLLNVGAAPVAGLMTIPDDCGPVMKPAWTGYIWAQDVDAKAKEVEQLGGKVYRAPADIPNVGRFAVVADPQGATFQLFAPSMTDQGDMPKPPAQGTIGWHELNTENWQGAFDFYSKLFGWTKDQAIDMGDMGTYQLFAAGAEAIGGMMNRMDKSVPPMWNFYFCVDNIDAAQERVTSKGGKVLFGPQEVPGGAFILQCLDPQGAMFCLVGMRS